MLSADDIPEELFMGNQVKISFIFPSRSRPKKFFDILKNIDHLSHSKNYEVICVLDANDRTMNNDEVKNKAKEYKNAKLFYGISGGKIAACNREISKISDDTRIVVLQSDDMVWGMSGFDNEIRNAFYKNFPDFDGVVHFPEEKTPNKTMVLTMMGINLLKKLGYLYYPYYESVYADNDLTEMTKAMGKYAFVGKLIYSHRHPILHKGEWDAQYRHTERPEVYKKDREVYVNRQINKFGL